MCQEFTKTTFKTKPIAASTGSTATGVPIGQGKCKAVRLRINALIRDSLNPTSIYNVGYYGDSQAQENELFAGVDTTGGNLIAYQSDWTPKIYCQNLEEIFVRGTGNPFQLQIMILD